MLLRDQADERLDSGDVAVDRLQPGGEGRAPDADDRVTLGRVAAERDRVAVGVLQLDEVEDVRIVDRVVRVDQRVRGKAGGGLAGDRGERRLRRQAVGPPQIVVVRHPVVATAFDVNRAQILDAREAVGVDGRRAAGSRVRDAGLRNLEEDAAQ